MKNRNRLPNRWLGIARVLLASTTFVVGATTLSAQRYMENLGRGVVAVRASSANVLVTWRLLGLDPAGIGFNVYRGATKLNGSVLTGGTNFTDTTANLAAANTYSVRPVIGGVEQASGGAFTLKANSADEPIVRINLVAQSGYTTKFIWVGDLDGDKEYDYVIDRLAPADAANDDIGLGNQFLEAYKPNGTRLWRIDMGPSSRDLYNIKPGAATLSMGMYDGATVYDLNNDGKAEVILKIASGVKFANGTTFTNADATKQFLAVIDGLTGNLLGSMAFPTDHQAAGKLGTQLGIGYADGVNPSIYFWGRNRNADLSFNDIYASYRWNGGASFTQNWKFLKPSTDTRGLDTSHQLRIADVDGNGTDEFMTGDTCINSNGTLRYVLSGIGHGDRFYVGKLDPNRAGLQGFGIQQHPVAPYTLEYYYDATTGAVIWKHNGAEGADVGRGLVGDLDGTKLGYEVFSFNGLWNARTNTLAQPDKTLNAYPNQMIWWDGDITSELLNDSKVEKWNPAAPTPTNAAPRLFQLNDYGAVISNHNPMFIGDILGDWRTEVIALNAAHSQLMIFTTDIPTGIRAYTMPHNPAYRAHMTVKGYLQSPLLDYYFGAGMGAAPVPKIKYVNGTPAVPLAQPANGTYAIINVNSGKCIDELGNGTVAGSNCEQWDYLGGADQKWVVTSLCNGEYSITCAASALKLQFDAAATPIAEIATASTAAVQKWTFVVAADGYSITNVGNGKVLDVANYSVANGGVIQGWTNTGTTNQKWLLQAP